MHVIRVIKALTKVLHKCFCCTYACRQLHFLGKKAGLPEPEFKEEFGGFSVCFYKDIYTEENLRRMGLNERQIKALKYLKERGKITNKEYQEIAGVSKPTASRELAMLVSGKVLEQQGITGKGTFYILIKGSQTAQTMINAGREYFY